MRWFDRFATLIKADAHGVLEQLEERSLLAKQHLREAELELGRKSARCEALDDESRRLADEAERLRSEIASLDEDVELALSGDKDELARFSVRRLLPKQRALEDIVQRRAEISEEHARLGEKLEAQRAELDTLARRVAARLASEREGGTGGRPSEAPAADEEVELELLRRRRAVDVAPGTGR